MSKEASCKQGIPAKQKPTMLFSLRASHSQAVCYTLDDQRNTVFMPAHFLLQKEAAGRAPPTSLLVWFSLAPTITLICNVPAVCSHCNCLAHTCQNTKWPWSFLIHGVKNSFETDGLQLQSVYLNKENVAFLIFTLWLKIWEIKSSAWGSNYEALGNTT